jgi:hypothetical protein
VRWSSAFRPIISRKFQDAILQDPQWRLASVLLALLNASTADSRWQALMA